MIKQLISYKIESLLIKAPSVIRVGTMVWPLKIISIILSPFFIIGGSLIVVASNQLLESIKDEQSDLAQKAQLISIIGLVGGIGMVVAGILFIIIAWLSKLIQNRNDFVVETEEVLESVKRDLQAAEEMPKGN